jgi:hypothetical protein
VCRCAGPHPGPAESELQEVARLLDTSASAARPLLGSALQPRRTVFRKFRKTRRCLIPGAIYHTGTHAHARALCPPGREPQPPTNPPRYVCELSRRHARARAALSTSTLHAGLSTAEMSHAYRGVASGVAQPWLAGWCVCALGRHIRSLRRGHELSYCPFWRLTSLLDLLEG